MSVRGFSSKKKSPKTLQPSPFKLVLLVMLEGNLQRMHVNASHRASKNYKGRFRQGSAGGRVCRGERRGERGPDQLVCLFETPLGRKPRRISFRYRGSPGLPCALEEAPRAPSEARPRRRWRWLGERMEKSAASKEEESETKSSCMSCISWRFGRVFKLGGSEKPG